MALCLIGFSNIEIVWIDTIPNIGIYKYTPEADTSPIAVYFYSSDSYSAASHVEIKFFNHFINIYIFMCMNTRTRTKDSSIDVNDSPGD